MYNQMSHDVTIGICKNFMVIYYQNSINSTYSTHVMNDCDGMTRLKENNIRVEKQSDSTRIDIY